MGFEPDTGPIRTDTICKTEFKLKNEVYKNKLDILNE